MSSVIIRTTGFDKAKRTHKVNAFNAYAVLNQPGLAKLEVYMDKPLSCLKSQQLSCDILGNGHIKFHRNSKGTYRLIAVVDLK